jgi:hypothetical protein
LFIIQFLPIYLVKSTRVWLDHLVRNAINCWDDLWEVFTDNFSGTYVCLGNPWVLKVYRQKQGGALQDSIRHFSRKCHELPSVVETDVVSGFLDGTTCCSLVHELGREQPKAAKELLDIITQLASGEEAVRAAFTLAEVGVTAGGGRTTPPSITVKGTKKGLRLRGRSKSAAHVVSP